MNAELAVVQQLNSQQQRLLHTFFTDYPRDSFFYPRLQLLLAGLTQLAIDPNQRMALDQLVPMLDNLLGLAHSRLPTKP